MKKILSTIFGKSRSRSRAVINKDEAVIYEWQDFHRLIQAERDRVHRNDMQFSLVLFNVNGNGHNGASFDELCNRIFKRVRRIDQIGWYDNDHLGLLLPDTPKSGAQVIARYICENNNLHEPIESETFSYP